VLLADRSCPASGAFAPVLGVPMLVRAATGLLASGVVGEVAVVVEAQSCVDAVRLLKGLPVTVHPDPAVAAAAVERRLGDVPAVLLHDAARPLTPPGLVEEVVRSVDDDHGIVVPVLPLADSVKHVNGDGRVVGGPDRAGLRVLQTPQAFRPALLTAEVLGHLLAADPVEQAWAAVAAPTLTVPGHPLAFPVRSAWDRRLAELLCEDG
jgi:2-C-methyl-D-erythritol 4-phosphate cytidylyltransferase